MCGDFDDQERIDDELFEQFLELAQQFDVHCGGNGNGRALPLHTESDRAEYMNSLFRAALHRCINDVVHVPRGERMDAIAGQAITFGRLAGFLAAQLPPEADLFRAVTGAVVDGHKEPASHR